MKLKEKQEKLERIINSLLLTLGVNLDDANFKDTPNRVTRMFLHFFRGKDDADIEKIMGKVFPSKNDQMVIVKDIECFGMCPHHLVPIVYSVTIGYVPQGQVIGLSKLARLAIALSSYPKLQEDFTTEIADAIQHKLMPQGVMVVVKGNHGCMKYRGVEMDSETITSDCRGVLRDEPEARMEFLELIR